MQSGLMTRALTMTQCSRPQWTSSSWTWQSCHGRQVRSSCERVRGERTALVIADNTIGGLPCPCLSGTTFDIFLYLQLSRSISLCLHLSLSESLSHSVSLCLSLCLSVCLSLSLSLSLSVSLSLSLSVSLSLLILLLPIYMALFYFYV